MSGVNMSKLGVTLKIDVSKIDKDKLFKGAKGTYLDAQVFINLSEEDQYGNSGMITQQVSKEERGRGEKGAILGNCKIFWRDQGQPSQSLGNSQPVSVQAQPEPVGGKYNDPFSDDIPF